MKPPATKLISLILTLGLAVVVFLSAPVLGSNVSHAKSEWQAIDTFWENIYFSLPRNWDGLRSGLKMSNQAFRNAHQQEPVRSQLYPVVVNIMREDTEVVTLTFSVINKQFELAFTYEPLLISEEGFLEPYRQKIVYQFARTGLPRRLVLREMVKKYADGSESFVEIPVEPARPATSQDFQELTELLQKLADDYLRDQEWLKLFGWR